jgi:hypothetical protein
MAGCGSGTPAAGTAHPDSGSEQRKYEATFHPSEFDPPPAVMLRDKQATGTDTAHTSPLPVQTPGEYAPGFRVQIFSSTDIDEANGFRTAAEQRFPTESFYIVYEPPTYKVRAGDFQQRYDADRLAKTLREGGYSDSWIVPDRVLKVPPVKTPTPVEGSDRPE